jgi:hypothetical protein
MEKMLTQKEDLYTTERILTKNKDDPCSKEKMLTQNEDPYTTERIRKKK